MRTKKKKKFPDGPKGELMEKLCDIRKGMASEVLEKWQDWANSNYSRFNADSKLSEVTFKTLTRGERLADWNMKFAIELATEGKRLTELYNTSIAEQVKNI